MKLLVMLPAVLLGVLGIAAVIYGGADDSPGLQGIGALLVIAAIAYAVRAHPNRDHQEHPMNDAPSNKLRWAVLPLRIVMAMTFALILMLEFFSFPGDFIMENRRLGQPVDWEALVLVEIGLVCVQVVIVCTWKLLTMVQHGRVFTRASLRWVDTIIGAIAVAWLLLLTLVVFVFSHADDPGAPVALSLVFLSATVFALLMVVMRELLVQATALKSDMEAVI